MFGYLGSQGARALRGAAMLGLSLALLGGCQGNPAPASAPGVEEWVDTGYGLVSREKATGAVSAAQEDELDLPVQRVEELIQGRFPGVHVRHLAGGGYQIQIRGRQTVLGSTEPLVVIDGMPISFGVRHALAQINPRDVARIEVLKDAASTAMYGMRGANGVILIRTKR